MIGSYLLGSIATTTGGHTWVVGNFKRFDSGMFSYFVSDTNGRCCSKIKKNNLLMWYIEKHEVISTKITRLSLYCVPKLGQGIDKWNNQYE